MASNERNALAELAERLTHGKYVLSEDVILASRIIAELAKCSGCIHRAGTTLMYTPEERMAIISAVDNCRAIAEE